MPLYEFQCRSCRQTVRLNITPDTTRPSDAIFYARNLRKSTLDKLDGEVTVEVEVEKVVSGCSENGDGVHSPNYETVAKVN